LSAAAEIDLPAGSRIGCALYNLPV